MAGSVGKRILFCWELGGGSGHLEGFGELARRFTLQGHDVTFATRNLRATRSFGPTSSLELIQAPMTWPPPKHKPVVSLADMLLKFRFDRTDDICAVVDDWLRIFRSVNPDLIVAEHSPTAVVAAQIVGIKLAIQGTGFTAPPPVSPMPGYFSSEKLSCDQVNNIECVAVSAINQILARYGASNIDALKDLYSKERSFLLTYPELDHFGSREGATYYGTPDQSRYGSDPVWPDGHGEKVFVYLHPDYPQFPIMLEQLSELNYRVLVVAPGIDRELAERSTYRQIRIVEGHVNLDKLAPQCGIAICHASHGAVARILKQGIAPIVTPNFVEQVMLARRLACEQLSFAAYPDASRHDYRSMLRAVLQDKTVRRNAECFAERNLAVEADVKFEQLSKDLFKVPT